MRLFRDGNGTGELIPRPSYTLYKLYPGNVARYIYIRLALFAFKYSLLIYWRVRLGRMDATTTGQRYHIPHGYASKKNH